MLGFGQVRKGSSGGGQTTTPTLCNKCVGSLTSPTNITRRRYKRRIEKEIHQLSNGYMTTRCLKSNDERANLDPHMFEEF